MTVSTQHTFECDYKDCDSVESNWTPDGVNNGPEDWHVYADPGDDVITYCFCPVHQLEGVIEELIEVAAQGNAGPSEWIAKSIREIVKREMEDAFERGVRFAREEPTYS